MHADRIAEIRDQHNDELRTHGWADRVIDELLTAAERTQSVQETARLAVRHLRTAAYRLQDTGDPEAGELLATADALADDLRYALTAETPQDGAL